MPVYSESDLRERFATSPGEPFLVIQRGWERTDDPELAYGQSQYKLRRTLCLGEMTPNADYPRVKNSGSNISLELETSSYAQLYFSSDRSMDPEWPTVHSGRLVIPISRSLDNDQRNALGTPPDLDGQQAVGSRISRSPLEIALAQDVQRHFRALAIWGQDYSMHAIGQIEVPRNIGVPNKDLQIVRYPAPLLAAQKMLALIGQDPKSFTIIEQLLATRRQEVTEQLVWDVTKISGLGIDIRDRAAHIHSIQRGLAEAKQLGLSSLQKGCHLEITPDLTMQIDPDFITNLERRYSNNDFQLIAKR